MRRHQTALFIATLAGITGALALAPSEESAAQQKKAVKPIQQPGTDFAVYSPKKHELYDGKWRVTASKIYQIGTLNDKPGWDHIDNDAATVRPAEGTIDIDVNEIKNTGTVVAKFKVPEGNLVIEFDQFKEGQPCQDGGIAAFIYEHGDSGCGDSLWPKTLSYLAGWGIGHATLNGKPLYKDYQVHFMITQGMRDRESLKTSYPMLDKKSPAGEVNPAMIQLDFWIRSPAEDKKAKNNPPREVFDHFFCMEVTFK